MLPAELAPGASHTKSMDRSRCVQRRSKPAGSPLVRHLTAELTQLCETWRKRGFRTSFPRLRSPTSSGHSKKWVRAAECRPKVPGGRFRGAACATATAALPSPSCPSSSTCASCLTADPIRLLSSSLSVASVQDELYLQLLTEACHDAVRRVLGPRGALRWAGETRAAAQLLYFALTTGSGLQTLGEEYCDMEQVAGPAGHAVPPGTVRRGLLVLLQAAGPYLADRLAQAAPGADDEEDGWAAWQRAQAAAAQLRQQEAAQPAGQQPAGAEASAGQVFLQQLALAAQQLRAAAQRAVQPVARRLPVAAALLRDHAATLLRLHLALFYIFGRYYQPSKRATGACGDCLLRTSFLARARFLEPSHVCSMHMCMPAYLVVCPMSSNNPACIHAPSQLFPRGLALASLVRLCPCHHRRRALPFLGASL